MPRQERFNVRIDAAKVERILARVRDYDWAPLPRIDGWDAGIDLDFLQRVCARWIDGWSWSRAEAVMNRHAQFTVEVEGQRVHYIHERPAVASGHPPLLLLNGWPGTCYEFEAVVDGLVAAGVEVVVPSLPGYGFSTPLQAPIGVGRTGGLLDQLMTTVLGHRRYVVHGIDWGASIAGRMAMDHPDTCAAVHLGMLAGVMSARPEADDERAWAGSVAMRWARESGYYRLQSTKPQTLGVALAGNPVGVAAWILEKYVAWSRLPTPDGDAPDVWATYSEDQLIDIVMLYLLTDTIVTSMWMYLNARGEGRQTRIGNVRAPVGVAVFADPIGGVPPRSIAERSFNLVHWAEMPRGGHFPGLEAPDLLTDALLDFLEQPEVVAAAGGQLR